MGLNLSDRRVGESVGLAGGGVDDEKEVEGEVGLVVVVARGSNNIPKLRGEGRGEDTILYRFYITILFYGRGYYGVEDHRNGLLVKRFYVC